MRTSKGSSMGEFDKSIFSVFLAFQIKWICGILVLFVSYFTTKLLVFIFRTNFDQNKESWMNKDQKSIGKEQRSHLLHEDHPLSQHDHGCPWEKPQPVLEDQSWRCIVLGRKLHGCPCGKPRTVWPSVCSNLFRNWSNSSYVSL